MLIIEIEKRHNKMVDRIRWDTVSYLPFYYVFFQFLLLTIFNLQANILTTKDILSNLEWGTHRRERGPSFWGSWWWGGWWRLCPAGRWWLGAGGAAWRAPEIPRSLSRAESEPRSCSSLSSCKRGGEAF